MTEPAARLPTFLQGGGVTGELVRSIDWSRTPVGPIASWPASLATTVGTLLHSRHPMFLWWGRDLVQFYNDAYLPSFGRGKHPAAMGQRGEDCWQEIWPVIWPQIDQVMRRAEASWNEDQLIPIFRNGRLEEVFWTYGYSPVFDDGGTVGGTLVVCTETTTRVVSERRLRTLRRFVERTVLAASQTEVLEGAADVFGGEPADVPFALLYRTHPDTQTATLVTSVGIAAADCAALDAVVGGRLHELALDPAAQALPQIVAGGGNPWPEPVTHAFVARIASRVDQAPGGYVVFGLSPRLPFEKAYRDYLRQLAEHVAQAQSRVETLHLREKGHRERETLLRELESASRAKDEFLAMLGHELRNPLAPILTALQLMRLRGIQGAEKERAVIERQVKHVVRLVDDLLDVSRITRGKIQLEIEPLRLADVVAKGIEMASPAIEQRLHRLVVDVPDALVVDGDAGRLAQVLSNVLTNAAKYTEPQGQIEVRAEARAGEAWITIRDTGVGIDPSLLAHMFDPFAQERQDSDRSQGGLGLGLAIVRNLVTLHGGAVTLESEGRGLGTACVVRLPLSRAGAQSSRGAPDSTAAFVAAGVNVLLVDDNADAADILAESLRAMGHRVRVAYDPVQALEIAREQPADVALLDLGLPVIDGYELAMRLRAQPGWEHVRLVALTGYGLENDRQRTRQAGFDEHFVKPIDVNTLDASLRSARPQHS
jgi:signal transduction histidine kinase/ActR/RegA family two-component response regulator